MCFDDRRRNRRIELICACREVRSDRDNRDRRDRNREVELRCDCRECNRRNSDRRW